MLHAHRWKTLMAKVTATYSKRDCEMDEQRYTADVEVCERCGAYQLKPEPPWHPVEIKTESLCLIGSK